jgi:hypothetical protein
VAINNFVARTIEITFTTFFYYNGFAVARTVRIRLTILYRSSLRNLQEVNNETALCTINDPTQTEGYVKYDCLAPKNESLNVDQIVINPLITFDNNTLNSEEGDINFSEEAALAALNLQNQTKKIDTMYKLNNGQLTRNPNKYFIIKGDVDNYNGKVGDNLVLVVYDNSTDPSTPQNVSCTIQSVNDKNYEFRCTPTQNVKGTIYLSPMYFGNNVITLNMTAPNSDYISYSVDGGSSGGNGTTIRNNPIYRKSSSGLSGGAIAGIVIACAVVLIIASIVAMMLRKPAAPVNNTSSVIGLRTVDNYTE